MPSPSKAERRLAAQIAAHESWALTEDRSKRTAPARAALDAKFLQEADPEGRLTPDERARRAEHIRKAYYQRLALASARARRIAKEATLEADAADSRLAGGDL